MFKRQATVSRKQRDQILQHRTHAAGHLDAATAKLTNLRDCERHEILPVRSAIHETKIAARIMNHPIVQTTLSNLSQQNVDLIKGQNGGGWVIDRRGERFRSDVNDDSKRKCGILLQGAFAL